MAVDGVDIVYGGVPSVTRTVESAEKNAVHDRLSAEGEGSSEFLSRREEYPDRTHRFGRDQYDWARAGGRMCRKGFARRDNDEAVGEQDSVQRGIPSRISRGRMDFADHWRVTE